MSDKIEALKAERDDLIAANASATSWGAALGARQERINEIEREILREERAARIPERDDEALVETVANAMRNRDLFTHRTNKWRQDGKPFEVIRVFRNGDDPILIEPYATAEEADRAVWQCQLESDARAVLAALREAGALK